MTIYYLSNFQLADLAGQRQRVRVHGILVLAADVLILTLN
jgi:energy-coupling factor transporter ATP-binding protein EcfA2